MRSVQLVTSGLLACDQEVGFGFETRRSFLGRYAWFLVDDQEAVTSETPHDVA
jgi:hypothetical protein